MLTHSQSMHVSMHNIYILDEILTPLTFVLLIMHKKYVDETQINLIIYC